MVTGLFVVCWFSRNFEAFGMVTPGVLFVCLFAVSWSEQNFDNLEMVTGLFVLCWFSRNFAALGKVTLGVFLRWVDPNGTLTLWKWLQKCLWRVDSAGTFSNMGGYGSFCGVLIQPERWAIWAFTAVFVMLIQPELWATWAVTPVFLFLFLWCTLGMVIAASVVCCTNWNRETRKVFRSLGRIDLIENVWLRNGSSNSCRALIQPFSLNCKPWRRHPVPISLGCCFNRNCETVFWFSSLHK